MDKIKAATIYAAHVTEAREFFAKKVDVLYDLWIDSDMSAIERDNRMASIKAQLEAAIEGEKAVYHLNLANPEDWGCAL